MCLSHGKPLHRYIRKIRDGIVSTFAGAPQVPGLGDGDAAHGRFTRPHGLRIDPNGDGALVADGDNYRVCHVSPTGLVSSVAGTGRCGLRDAAVYHAEFTSPRQLAVMDSDSLLVIDSYSNRIRLVRSNENRVYTYAGVPHEDHSAAMGSSEPSVAGHLRPTHTPSPPGVLPAGNVTVPNLVATHHRHATREESHALHSTHVGRATSERSGATENSRTKGPNTTTSDVSASASSVEQRQDEDRTATRIQHATFDFPRDIVMDGAGMVFVAEGNEHSGRNNRIRMINSYTGAVHTLVGHGAAAPGYKDGSTQDAKVNYPIGMAICQIDDYGCLIFADSNNHCIRSVRCIEYMLT